MKKKILFFVVTLLLVVSTRNVLAQEPGRIETLMGKLFTELDMAQISYVAIFQDTADPRGSSKMNFTGCSSYVEEIYQNYMLPGGTLVYSVRLKTIRDPKQSTIYAIENTSSPIVASGQYAINASVLTSTEGTLWIWRNPIPVICPDDRDIKVPPVPSKGEDEDPELQAFREEIDDVWERVQGGETFQDETWVVPEEPVPELVPAYQLPSGQHPIQAGSSALALGTLLLLFVGCLFIVLRLRRAA